MYEKVSDALGLPGECILIETRSFADIKAEILEIINSFPEEGKMEDIPEGNTKQRLRELFTAIGFNVQF